MTHNYNEKYTQITVKLTETLRTKSDTAPYTYRGETYDLRNRQARIDVINRISRDYMAEHGEYNQRAIDKWREDGEDGERPASVLPNTVMLDALADAILHEELTDPHPDKVTRTEYPFMSASQMEERYDKEVSGKWAEDYGTDGRNHIEPTRRRRNKYENWFVDHHAQIRNKDRAAQYKKDTSSGELVAYNLNDTGGLLADEFVNCVGTSRILPWVGAV